MTNSQFLHLNTTMETMGKAMESLAQQVLGLTVTTQSLTTQVEGISIRVDKLSTKVDVLSDRVDGLSDRVDDLSTQVVSLDKRVDDLSTQVVSLDKRVDVLSNQIVSIDKRVDSLSTRVDGLSTKVDLLDERLTSEVGRLEYKLDDFIDFVADRFASTEERLGNLEVNQDFLIKEVMAIREDKIVGDHRTLRIETWVKSASKKVNLPYKI